MSKVATETISRVVKKAIGFAGCLGALSGCTAASHASDVQFAEQNRIRQEEQVHLANFDDLDFNVYTGQKWDELTKSHAKDILVHYPDGHTTRGLDAHIDELKPMFIFAPDTRIKEHPVRIASNEWTAVSGLVEGTFTQPMPIGPGKTIPPTNKPFKFTMVTLGRWKDGVMTEEWLYWDNQAFMKQVGLTQ